MSPEEDALGRVVALLSRLDIPYMLTGSVAASYYGRPRATHDADLVVDPRPQQMRGLIDGLCREGFLVDADGALNAFRQRRMFNAIEGQSACKIDFVFRKDRPFSREEFSRRTVADLSFGEGVSIVTAEDAIVSKLEWARRSGDSERQLADAKGVLDVASNVDREYIGHWVRELGVADLWQRIAAQ